MQQTEISNLQSRQERTERVVEQTISLFRGGYILSFTFVFIGLIVALVRNVPLASELGPPKELINLLLELDPNGFMGLGIGLMILTPIVMTVEVAINFLRGQDPRFAAISGLVALILIVTMALAFI